jgi:hypothetical protein
MNREHESASGADDGRSEFERRVAGLLNDSADGLDGRTRSALTRARHAALAQAARPRASSWRVWAPAGALAAGLLVAVLFVGQQGRMDRPLAAGGAVDDLALLSDADAYELSTDTDMDLDSDFYEWAAATATTGGSRGLGG